MDVFEGFEISDEIKAKVTERIELVKNELQTKLEAETLKFQEAIQTRDSAKAKLREYESKFKDVDLDSLKQAKAELEAVKPELESFRTKAAELEERYKENLKSKFSSEKWELVKDLDLQRVEELAKLESKAVPATAKIAPAGSQTGSSRIYTKDEYLQLTKEQRLQIPRADIMKSMQTWQ